MYTFVAYTNLVKKITLFLFALLICQLTIGQDKPVKLAKKPKPPYYKIGLGVEYSHPLSSVSVKLGISKHSVLQAIISPVNFDDYGYSYYGIKYNYLFNSYRAFGRNSIAIPFLYAGGGILNWSYNNSGFVNGGKTTYSAPGFSAGLGYEVIFGRIFGITLEAGYGALSASKTETFLMPTGGLGFHFYFGAEKNAPSSYEGTLPMGKEKLEKSSETEEANEEANEEDDKDQAKSNDKKDDKKKEKEE